MLPTPEQTLLDALHGAFTSHRRICTARAEPAGGIAVMFYEHLRGVWRHEPSGFVFSPSREAAATYRCPSVAEAVLFTLEGVCRT